MWWRSRRQQGEVVEWLYSLVLSVWSVIGWAETLPEQHLCPAPREILLVRCPTLEELTGPDATCKRKVRIDECSRSNA